MSVESFSFLFGVFALLCWVGVLGVVVSAVGARSGEGSLVRLRGDLGRVALPLAWIVALVTTAGSLYYSKVQGYVPCELCWYQRIIVYPFSVVLGIAAWRRAMSEEATRTRRPDLWARYLAGRDGETGGGEAG